MSDYTIVRSVSSSGIYAPSRELTRSYSIPDHLNWHPQSTAFRPSYAFSYMYRHNPWVYKSHPDYYWFNKTWHAGRGSRGYPPVNYRYKDYPYYQGYIQANPTFHTNLYYRPYPSYWRKNIGGPSFYRS
uniref:Uncharacterized protein n=1 Tax=Acrobeloides nanus TaxID=290746 RepID=A0A914DDX9_9BILA